MMTTFLVLLGVYVYFLIGNLFYALVRKFTDDCSDRGPATFLFPLFFIYGTVYIIHTIIKKLKLKISIPFTPRKVAEFISNPKNYQRLLDFVKNLVNFRIKIERSIDEKNSNPKES